MPSATQEESMRMLCDMLGYSMKYYQSATTDIVISYRTPEGGQALDDDHIIALSRFQNVKNADDDVNYFLLDSGYLTKDAPSRTLRAIEGELVWAEDGDLVKLGYLDDNHRYILPETQVAENGIFIFDDESDVTSAEPWRKVDNLNAQDIGTKCFKFGYDSHLNAPYVQFPDDIADLIGEGVMLGYTRTHGANGNISARTLSAIAMPDMSGEEIDGLINAKTEDMSAHNPGAAVNGCNPETLNRAYSNYKKTIGTFDTLVACRDYINYIYRMTADDVNQTPLVSNVIVSDIRSDINRAITLCTFDDYGICYEDLPRTKDDMTHFDLMVYPFKTYNGLRTKLGHDTSFKVSYSNWPEIKAGLADAKTISHNLRQADQGDVACVKCYVRLKATITTTYKVNKAEQSAILANVYAAIYDSFNLRELDFGEEIPLESIIECIKGADARIKDVSYPDPDYVLKTMTVDGSEIGEGLNTHLKMLNVLAGKTPLFEYDESFSAGFDEVEHDQLEGKGPIFENIEKITTNMTVDTTPKDGEHAVDDDDQLLRKGEIVQFRKPHMTTITTYPAYVHYFVKLSSDTKTVPANSEYKLENGEHVYFCYTEKQDLGDGTTKETLKGKDYSAGTVIKANFDLVDSKAYHDETNKSYPYTKEKFSTVTELSGLEGMYTLGAQQRIEILDEMTVNLNEPCYVYWTRADDADNTENEQTTWTWTEDGGNAYTLGEGEYFYLTDAGKTDIAAYGSGTKIKRTGDFELKKKASEEDTSAEAIAEYGAAASINWIFVNLSASGNKLMLQEYQYFNLTAGDRIIG